MGNGPLLSVRNLRTEFRTRRGIVTAVNDVSFDLAPGESLGLVGESGSGKSVMMQSVLGLAKPAAGRSSSRAGISRSSPGASCGRCAATGSA